MITAEARALARATLDGDYSAADALADWCLEQRSHPRKSITQGYVERLEDALREIKRLLRTRLQSPMHVIAYTAAGQSVAADEQGRAVVVDGGGVSLTAADFDSIYNRCFSLEREARTLGREGPA